MNIMTSTNQEPVTLIPGGPGTLHTNLPDDLLNFSGKQQSYAERITKKVLFTYSFLLL